MEKEAYEEQVQLCPPDEFSREASPAAQVSMGIVSVRENGQWGSLNENDSSSRTTHHAMRSQSPIVVPFYHQRNPLMDNVLNQNITAM